MKPSVQDLDLMQVQEHSKLDDQMQIKVKHQSETEDVKGFVLNACLLLLLGFSPTCHTLEVKTCEQMVDECATRMIHDHAIEQENCASVLSMLIGRRICSVPGFPYSSKGVSAAFHQLAILAF